MQADLVVLNADPSEDIRALSDVRYTRQRKDAHVQRRVPRAGRVAACSSRRIKRACLKTVHRETLGVVAVVRTRQGKKSGRGAWWGAYPCARIRATPALPPIPALRCALARTPPLPAIPTAFSVVLSCQPWENGPTD